MNAIYKSVKAIIHVRVPALTWEIWNCHNGVVFNKIKVPRNEGYPSCGLFDTHVVLSFSYGSVGSFQFWMYSIATRSEQHKTTTLKLNFIKYHHFMLVGQKTTIFFHLSGKKQ
jgi:hypothetical protein